MNSPVKQWRRQKIQKLLLGKIGTILSWTKIYVSPPHLKKQTPYIVVLVQFENGERAYGRLVDYKEDSIEIGMHVRGTLRRVADTSSEQIIAYGVKFKPVV